MPRLFPAMTRFFLLPLLALLVLTACNDTITRDMLDEVPPPAPSNARVDTLAVGTFVGREGQGTSGTYRIERVDGNLRLVFSSNFRTDNGPDLHVVLSPTTFGTVTNRNALASGALVLGPLAAFNGAQAYDLRDDLDVRAFKSVLIHCVRYSHLFGAAPLP